ncbi:hypothetical protein Bca101_032711 [Brassica carinata]
MTRALNICCLKPLKLASLLGSNEQLIPWHIDKLKKVVEEGNAYGALQMYKSISARYVTAQRFFSHIQKLLGRSLCVGGVKRNDPQHPLIMATQLYTNIHVLAAAEADVSSTSNSRIPPEQLEQNRKDGESDDPTLRSLLEYSGDCRSEMVVQVHKINNEDELEEVVVPSTNKTIMKISTNRVI